MKTKAVRMYGTRDLRLEEFELPQIKDDEILVKIMSDSICMSTYKLAEQGKKHKRAPQNIDTNPIITGHNPGGLAIILLSRSLYRRSTVSCALFGVAIFNRLIIFSILRADACVTFMPCATGAAGNGYGVLLSVCRRGVLLTRTMALAT